MKSQINILNIMENKDFIVFIITHGRPNNVITYKTLKNSGYTGGIYLIIDNEDKTANRYYNKFGYNKVIMFDKQEIAKTTDHGDNFWNLKTTIHARNACFEIARNLGFTYFLVLDDDYVKFDFRLNSNLDYPSGFFKIRNLDKIFDSYLNFYKSINAVSICMSQGGDYIGGCDNNFAKNILSRKAMNSWFCSINRPFKFISRLNEDVNTYMTLGSTGILFATIPFCSLTQMQTQGTSGGMTEAYLDGGTYVKSFYTVMYCPSFTKIIRMGAVNKRLHHSIDWSSAVPVIIDEKYKKY